MPICLLNLYPTATPARGPILIFNEEVEDTAAPARMSTWTCADIFRAENNNITAMIVVFILDCLFVCKEFSFPGRIGNVTAK